MLCSAREIEIDREVGVKRLKIDELQRLELVKVEHVTQARATLELMQRFPAQMGTVNREKILFMNMQMMQSMVRVIALEQPGYLREADTEIMLARMLYALLTTGSAASKQL